MSHVLQLLELLKGFHCCMAIDHVREQSEILHPAAARQTTVPCPIQMHIAKNFMAESLVGVRVPVMLGIWGPKGCGKTFMTELAFKKLG